MIIASLQEEMKVYTGNMSRKAETCHTHTHAHNKL